MTVLGADPEHAGEQWRARLGVVLQSWRDHAKCRVRELLSHLGTYFGLAALLPAHLAAVEIGGSWRPPYVFLALALWSLAGLAAAPPALRRMARRESGSRVAERRERAMLRAT